MRNSEPYVKTIGTYKENHYAQKLWRQISMEAGVDPTNEPYRRVPLVRR